MDEASHSERFVSLFDKLKCVKEEMQSWSPPVLGDEAVQLVQAAKDFLASVLQMTTAADIQVTQIFVETSGISSSPQSSKLKFSFDLDLYQQILSPNCIVKMEDHMIDGQDSEQQNEELEGEVIEGFPTASVEDINDHVLVQLEPEEALPLMALTEQNQIEERRAGGGARRRRGGEFGKGACAKGGGGVMTKLCPECNRNIPVTHLSRHSRVCAKLRKKAAEVIVQEPRVPTEKASYRCKTCDKRFAFMRNLRSHRVQTHQAKCTVPCTECAQKFFDVEERTRHMLERHGRRLHCDSCDFKTHVYNECVDHLQKTHQLTAEDGQIELLLSTEREVVKRRMKEACERCGKRFSPATLPRHQEKCTGEVKVAASKLTYLCTICGKALRFYTGLQNHIKHVHNKKYPYPCTECTMAYTHEIDRDHHLFSAHGLNPNNRVIYQCEICSFKALRKYYLTKHMKGTHKGIFSAGFTCKICGKEFQKLSGLQTHQIRHKVDKHQCQKCGFKCSVWKTYLQHMNTEHEGWRMHSCPGECGFKAGDRGSLNKHAKTCKKFSLFYATIWNEKLGLFQCQNSGCTFSAYNKHVFFKHLKKCGESDNDHK
ncbi:hypothetical protein CAPTEDRAFT_186090 [Capitella teleta]|uniref:C2H2-type domain-containing protein n=1 Tax=Capitella teleta TaxID=283909 RepID=R7TX19_CAPTE|nr:hypothetical protein CAPTEDRAFT_186090 [Capitella teleta]|eukprot:ELT95520.1 hypothetical protein CAPTEDRAFT_186090 [Capitella teleta]